MFYKKKSNQSVKITKKEELKTFFNERVYFGPFSGLKIPENLYSVLSLSEILGLYESCLHPIFEDVLNKNIKNAIIVGGNNGYYTAGLSYLFNPENFYVFEMDERMHFLIESWYKKNDLKNTCLYYTNRYLLISLRVEVEILTIYLKNLLFPMS